MSNLSSPSPSDRVTGLRRRRVAGAAAWSVVLAAIAVAFALGSPRTACAVPQRTWKFLTTGNGHGFQVFDSNTHKISTFLDHPYRYVRPSADPKSDGVGRRDLA